jgi:hypothetical protein
VVSSDVSLKEDMNLRALTSLLLAVNSSISKFFSPSKFIRVSFTPTTPTQLYTQSNLELPIENDSDWIIFSFVSLDSSEFLLQNKVALDRRYSSPCLFNLTFSPSVTGVRTAYLLVKTQDDFLVYYLQGIAEDNKYALQPVSSKIHGEIYGKVKIFNPENKSLIISIENIEGFSKDSLEIFKHHHYVNKTGNSEISLFKVKNKGSGRIKGKIWIDIDNEKFYLPVHGSRKTHSVDCGEIIDLGILAVSDMIFTFEIKCEKDPGFDFSYKNVEISAENVWIKTQKIKENSSHFLFGVLFIKTENPGFHSGSIRVDTNFETFLISFKYLAVFDLVQTDPDQFYFANLLETNRTICMKNMLNHEIWIKKFITSSELFTIITDNYFFSSQDTTCFMIRTHPVVLESFTLTIESSIGRIVFPLYSIEPYLHFFSYKDKKIQEVFGPVDLGNIGINLQVDKQLIIRNPWPVGITFYSIQSIPNVSLKYSMNTLTPPFSTFEFSLSIKSDFSIYSPLKIATSVGVFHLPVHANVLVGFARVKNIVFHSVYPKQLLEESIVLINNYSAPIKIHTITVYGENLGISKDVIEVQPFTQQVVGKVAASIKMHEKTNVDFKKSVTFGDVKRAVKMSHYEESTRSYEAKIFTDLAGEIKALVTLYVKKPALIVNQQKSAGYCLVKSECSFKLLVTNPLDQSVKVQLFTLPDNYQKTLKKFDCNPKKKHNDHNDEEFENLSEEQVACEDSQFSDQEEVKQIKQSSERRLKKPSSYSSLSLLSKVLKFLYFTCLSPSSSLENKTSDLEETSTKSVQSLYLNENPTYTLPPHGSRLIGPVTFFSQSPGAHQLPLMLKNNYTILETFEVHINSTVKRLAITKKSNYNFNDKFYTLQRSVNKKDFQKLPFEVNPEDISKFFINYVSMHSPIIFKTFDLQNVGTVDVEVKGIFINDFYCKSRGFGVANCGEQFLLRPGEWFTVEISYNLLESWSNDCSKLLILTDSEEFTFAIDTYLVDGLNLTNFLHVWAEIFYVVCASFTLALVVLTFRHGVISKRYNFEVKTTKELGSSLYQQYFCKKYSQPIMFTTNEEIVQVPEKQIKEQFIETSVAAPIVKTKKHFKVHRTLTNVVQASEIEKKQTRVVPEVIATNKFLVKNSKKSKNIKHSKSFVEKDKLDEKQEVKSDDDEVFIDAYKNTNRLFAVHFERESCSLAELTQDSDPVDTDSKFS